MSHQRCVRQAGHSAQVRRLSMDVPCRKRVPKQRNTHLEMLGVYDELDMSNQQRRFLHHRDVPCTLCTVQDLPYHGVCKTPNDTCFMTINRVLNDKNVNVWRSRDINNE